MTTPEEKKTTLVANICHKCGSSIPKEAPLALCPKCVLSAAASSSTPSNRSGRQTPPPALEEVADAFPDLEILELIGVGGMGSVYRTRQKSLDREVALKILSSDLSNDPAFAERFSREGRVLARLSHPNIVTIFDFGNKGPFCFLLMEYIDGVNLRQAMQAGDFTPSESLAMVQDICTALAFAHQKGILHRDIKPENILLDSQGKVKIADFGIAKLVGEHEQDDFTLTMEGSVMGSPQYMAPEQIETPNDVDQRADIYSLGVVLYELLTGELPLGRFAEPSKKVTLDQRVDELVMRSLEKEREARFQSADEVKTQVETITQTPAPVQNQTSESLGKVGSTQAPAAETSPSNLYANTSVFLTVSSLLVATAGIIASTFITQGREPLLDMLLWLVGIPAALGFIYGTMALGKIHRSVEPKVGLGAAMFGTWAWPQLGLIGLSIASFMMPSPSGIDDIEAKLHQIRILSVVLTLSGIPCAISIYAWAKYAKPLHKLWMLTSILFVVVLCTTTLWLSLDSGSSESLEKTKNIEIHENLPNNGKLPRDANKENDGQ